MNEALSIALVVLLFVILFVLCSIWHHITAMRYRKIKAEKGKQYKWYQLLGRVNEIGFWVKFIAAILLLMTLFVCMHYLCCTYPHKLTETPDFDYMSVICTFFGVLVTLLVGWNIYNVVDFKNKMEKLEADQNFIGECLLQSNKNEMSTRAYMLRFMAQCWSANLIENTPDNKFAMMIIASIGSIEVFLQNDNMKTANSVLDNLMEWIGKIDVQLTAKQKREAQKHFNKLPKDAEKLNRIDELKNFLFNEPHSG